MRTMSSTGLSRLTHGLAMLRRRSMACTAVGPYLLISVPLLFLLLVRVESARAQASLGT